MTMLATPAQIVRRPGSKPSEMLAGQLNVDPVELVNTLTRTVIPSNASKEECYAFCLVAATYQLNPLMREIYAFPKKGGGIQPIVGVDGWLKIINRQESLDGIEFNDVLHTNGLPVSTTCRIYIKGRSRPVEVTEYFDECKRNTEPWNQMPKRMMRHKSLIQCGRVAFGISGLYDEDEGRDIIKNDEAESSPSAATVSLNEQLREQRQKKELPIPQPPIEPTTAPGGAEPATTPAASDTADDDGMAVEEDAAIPPRDVGSAAAVPPPAEVDRSKSPPAASEPEEAGVLPVNCTETRFIHLASGYAPAAFSPDQAEDAVQRMLRIGVSKPWHKLTQAQKQAFFEKIKMGEMKWGEPK